MGRGGAARMSLPGWGQLIDRYQTVERWLFQPGGVGVSSFDFASSLAGANNDGAEIEGWFFLSGEVSLRANGGNLGATYAWTEASTSGGTHTTGTGGGLIPSAGVTTLYNVYVRVRLLATTGGSGRWGHFTGIRTDGTNAVIRTGSVFLSNGSTEITQLGLSFSGSGVQTSSWAILRRMRKV
jgi:hypothetical protein